VSAKVDEWQTISRLGWSLCAPKMYVLKPHVYHLACGLLFWLCAGCCALFSFIPWWTGAIVLCVAWIATGYRGHLAAFAAIAKS
jgi:hypothetical protein